MVSQLAFHPGKQESAESSLIYLAFPRFAAWELADLLEHPKERVNFGAGF